jgi:hypothetical protein
MDDSGKTKKELIQERQAMSQRVTEQEISEALAQKTAATRLRGIILEMY